MIKFIKNWLTERRNKQFEEFLKQKEEENNKKTNELEQTVIQVLENRDKMKYESEEPWVKLESAELHPEYGIQMKLDWNPAFIKHLRIECGFSGDEDTVIQQYIGALYKEIYLSSVDQKLVSSSAKLKE